MKEAAFDFQHEAKRVTDAIGSDNGRMTVERALREAFDAGAALGAQPTADSREQGLMKLNGQAIAALERARRMLSTELDAGSFGHPDQMRHALNIVQVVVADIDTALMRDADHAVAPAPSRSTPAPPKTEQQRRQRIAVATWKGVYGENYEPTEVQIDAMLIAFRDLMRAGSEGDVPAPPPEGLRCTLCDQRIPDRGDVACVDCVKDAHKFAAASPPGAADAREPQHDKEPNMVWCDCKGTPTPMKLEKTWDDGAGHQRDYRCDVCARKTLVHFGRIAPAAPRAEMEIPEKFWKRLLQQINDNDYCYLCDNHPSHGHAKDCPAATGDREEQP